ncbi:MAG TPA: hypothetical protein VHY76_07925 [Acetobacteraceae bacterium]|jgi:hypothetical protein|nr:hypothetical protein [Acetobacteraceae bacterium]
MTPSERIVAAATAPVEVEAADGRRLSLRRPDALDRLRLFKAVGPELAQNLPYLGLATLAFAVVEIDDVPVPQPVCEAQIESLVTRLGDAGLAAVAAGLSAQAESGEIDPGN